MRVRAVRGFVIGPGRCVANGEVFELDDRRLVLDGVHSVSLSHNLPRDYYEPAPEPVAAATPVPVPVPATAEREADHPETNPRPRRTRRARVPKEPQG